MVFGTDSIIGQTIADRYEVISELGRGAFGGVYLARHLSLNNMVALKVLHGHLVSEEENIVRFKREAEATCRLRQSNIASVFDFGVLPDGRPYMVMEHLQGSSLATLLESEGAMEPARCIPLFMECCDALHYAHSRGLLHRDIKPDNIFVTRDIDGQEHVKLLDFGLSKALFGEQMDVSSLTGSGYALGTPWYMSPEQCTSSPLDGRCDIYSLACTMYETLSGKRPVNGKNLYETLHAHLHEIPPPINCDPLHPKIPPALEAVVMRGLAKNPDDRFASARDYKQAIEAAMTRTAASVVPSTRAANVYSVAPAPASAPGGSAATSS
jgi:serine/threonine-protein kinase